MDAHVLAAMARLKVRFTPQQQKVASLRQAVMEEQGAFVLEGWSCLFSACRKVPQQRFSIIDMLYTDEVCMQVPITGMVLLKCGGGISVQLAWVRDGRGPGGTQQAWRHRNLCCLGRTHPPW